MRVGLEMRVDGRLHKHRCKCKRAVPLLETHYLFYACSTALPASVRRRSRKFVSSTIVLHTGVLTQSCGLVVHEACDRAMSVGTRWPVCGHGVTDVQCVHLMRESQIFLTRLDSDDRAGRFCHLRSGMRGTESVRTADH